MSDINQGGNENIEVFRSQDNVSLTRESSVSALGVIDKTDSGDGIVLLYELDHVRNASVSGNLEY